eukprot:jgi/Mesvir1/11582/Mv04344-RA.1
MDVVGDVPRTNDFHDLSREVSHAVSVMAAREHNRFAALFNKGNVSLPESSDVEVDLDKYFEQPLGPIRPFIRSKVVDNKTVVYRVKDIGMYITESIHGKWKFDKKICPNTPSGGICYNFNASDGGLHISLQLVKPFILSIPCDPDGIDKRVAISNRLLSLLGAQDTVVRSDVIVMAQRSDLDEDVLSREVRRRRVQVHFTIAWCEDVLDNYARVLRTFDDDSGTSRREFYALTRKMDRADVEYPDARFILDKLSQTPLPLTRTPSWVLNPHIVAESEIPKLDTRTENVILKAELAAKNDTCARLKKELDSMRARMAEFKSIVPCQQATDALQHAVWNVLDTLSLQLPPGVCALLESLRHKLNGEDGAAYKDRVRGTLQTFSYMPPVARALNVLYVFQ